MRMAKTVTTILLLLLLLSGCGTYKPCHLPSGEPLTQADANLLKNQGLTVSCPGDE
jgi:hypothetical protein